MKVRLDTGTYVIEEHDGPMVGEFRFSLDRRIAVTPETGKPYRTRTNITWCRTYRGALNALSMEQSANPTALALAEKGEGA